MKVGTARVGIPDGVRAIAGTKKINLDSYPSMRVPGAMRVNSVSGMKIICFKNARMNEWMNCNTTTPSIPRSTD